MYQVNINTKYIPLGHPNRPGDKLDKVLAGVVHYTANSSPGATDLMNAAYFGRAWETGKYIGADGTARTGPIEKGSMGKGKGGLGIGFAFGSTQRVCDKDSVTATIPRDEVAWGAGDRFLPWDEIYKGQQHLAHDVFGNRQNHLCVNWEICNNNTVNTPGKEKVT